uniref:Uncharacterized protein n=1 Tax=Tetranychus urticae TaxID=32264 RepID=T1KB05_TETUR
MIIFGKSVTNLWITFFLCIALCYQIANGDQKCRVPRYIACKKGDTYYGRLCVRQCSRKGVCVPCEYITDEYEGPKAIKYYINLCKQHYPDSESFVAPISQCWVSVD